RLCGQVFALQIDVELARAGVGQVGDRLFRRRNARDLYGTNLVGILFEVRVTEDAERAWLARDLLHEQIIIFARFHIGAVLADLSTDLLVLVLIALGERGHRRIRIAALGEIEVGEAVAGAGGRRRAKNVDLDRGKRRIHVLPRLRGVRALAERIGGECLV